MSDVRRTNAASVVVFGTEFHPHLSADHAIAVVLSVIRERRTKSDGGCALIGVGRPILSALHDSPNMRNAQ